MSIEVQLPRLAETALGYTFAYLVTVGPDKRAHVAAVTPVVHDDLVLVAEPGRTSTRNVAADSPVVLVWPPADPSGHTLIVDGVGETGADGLAVRPTRAVLHRPAPRPATRAGGCDSDCVEVAFTDVG
jgi:hypothetical protein